MRYGADDRIGGQHIVGQHGNIHRQAEIDHDSIIDGLADILHREPYGGVRVVIARIAYIRLVGVVVTVIVGNIGGLRGIRYDPIASGTGVNINVILRVIVIKFIAHR